MRIFALESSCDETAAAVVEDGWRVYSNVIASSLLKHRETGGVVPEVAARESAVVVSKVISEALSIAGCSWTEIDALAVTNGPGLLGSLLVGIEAAKTLAFLHQKPLIPVFHIAGHLFSNILERNEPMLFPTVSLTVAGGHNDLYLWQEENEFQKLGETLDDAAGEAFDKGARLLGLSYPGGPALSQLAKNGERAAFAFPRGMEHSADFQFSFSGLKTALFYELKHRGGLTNISETERADLAASYQEAIVDILLKKTFAAAEKYKAKEVHLAGGVSANKRLQERFIEEAKVRNLSTRIPEKIAYCTDNAAMIAAAAYGMWQKNETKKFPWEKVHPNLAHEFRFS